MMNFRDALCLWLAGHGLTAQECDQVCDDRRVAFSIKIEDPSGMLDDVRSALYSLRSQAGIDARHALNGPAEALLLMGHLENHVTPKATTSRQKSAPKATAQVEQLSDRETLLQRICRELELSRDEYKLLHQALA